MATLVKNRIGKLIEGNGHDAKLPAEAVKIIPLREKIITVRIVGTAAYMQNRFSVKAKDKMMATQMAGSQAKSKKVRDKRNFDEDCKNATYFLPDGSLGIPASAFRCACISACKLVGFAMTRAKCAVFIVEDGVDRVDGMTPLVRIEGDSEKTVLPARNDNGGCDLRSRPMWRKWSCSLRVRFDEDQFSASDIINLLIRAGRQIGVGEGRPDSKKSNGIGLGLFDVEIMEADNGKQAKRGNKKRD